MNPYTQVELTQTSQLDLINLVWFVAAIVVSVGVTLLSQRLLARLTRAKREKAMLELTLGGKELPPEARAVLSALKSQAGVDSDLTLIADAMRFEQAVEAYLTRYPHADLNALETLRRLFRLNVMNQNVELVNTRQLLKDMPVRLHLRLGDERLDVYCSLLTVHPRFMVFQLPDLEELPIILAANPNCQVIFWRDGVGEVVFPIVLEMVRQGTLVMFRARHVYCDKAVSRAEYRLSVDLPLRFRYIAQSVLVDEDAKAAPGQDKWLSSGYLAEEDSLEAWDKGHLIDLSFSGLGFTCDRQLPAGGMAHMAFPIHGQEIYLMTEILGGREIHPGVWLHNAQMRGVAPQGKVSLNRFLSREQVKRLREKDIIRVATQ